MKFVAVCLLAAALLCGCSGDQPGDPYHNNFRPRIVTLAPHLTELVYAVGAGDHLVGVVAYSDYPDAALLLPVIGDAFRIDPERLADADPDLVLAWAGGNPAEVIAQISGLGYEVVSLRTDSLPDIAENLVQIGALVGQAQQAGAVAGNFLQELEQIGARDPGRTLRVFYQISPRPLYTVGGTHPISNMIGLCGGVNVFAELQQLAPVVSLEAVVARNPDVIIAADPGGELKHWQRWRDMSAVANNNLFKVDASLVSRPSTRMLQGLRHICGHLETAREARPDDDARTTELPP